MHDYVVEIFDRDGSSYNNLTTTELVEVIDDSPAVVEVLIQGPQGSPGPVLLLEHGASVPPGTPAGTIIFEKSA